MKATDIFEAAAAKPLQIVRVDMPRYGQTWGVREMDARAYAKFIEEVNARIEADEADAWFACWTVCDPDTGALLFTPADMPRLMQLPGYVLRSVWIAGAELNGYGKQAEEVREKNSPTPSAATS